MHKGKKYVDSAKTIDRTKQYDPAEALSTVVSTAKAKFDETIELHVKLGVDSRHADQQVRGAIVLPHGTGKQVRVAVFAKGAKADEALAAGADIVGAEDLMERIQKENFFEFDVVIATPDMMGVVGGRTRLYGGLRRTQPYGYAQNTDTCTDSGFVHDRCVPRQCPFGADRAQRSGNRLF